MFDGFPSRTKWGTPRVSQKAIDEFGLIAVTVCNEMTGGITRELITGTPLIAAGGADWGGGADVFGARSNAANAAYRMTVPAAMRRPYPISLFCRGYLIGTPSPNAQFFGFNPNNTVAIPYVSAVLGVDNNGLLSAFGNDGATLTALTDGAAPATGVPISFGAVIKPGTAGFVLYKNGVSVASGFTLGTTNSSGPAYAASAQLTVGEAWASIGRNPNWIQDIGLIADRAWTAQQMASLHADPYQVLEDEYDSFLAELWAASGIIILGLALETDTAFAIGRSKSLAVGLASETDTAFAVARTKSRAVGLATEADSAFAIGRLKSLPIGLASEAASAFAVVRSKVRAIGLASETDSAFDVTGGSAPNIGQALETDSAFGLTWSKSRAVGLAVETDSAFAIGRLKSRVLGLASDTSSAFAVARSKLRAIGLAVETGSAFAIDRVKSRVLGLAVETDSAFAITPPIAPPGIRTIVLRARSGIARLPPRSRNIDLH